MIIALNGKRRMTPGQFSAIVDFIDTLRKRLDNLQFIVHPKYLEALMAMAPEACLPPGLQAGSGRMRDADMAISIGGDGTMLRTARWIGNRGIPLLGLNSGRLGFLADTPLERFNDVVDDIAAQRLVVQDRTLLEVNIGGIDVSRLPDPERVMSFPYALNEVAVIRDETASMISIDTTLDGVPLAVYQADGLIVATPTGSTGYNLSVGGPIMSPDSRCWAISPVAAHSLTMRPLTVSDKSVVGIKVDARVHSYRLSLDGRSITLPLEARLRLSRAPFVTKVLTSPSRSFADTLRAKLLWGLDGR